MLQRKSSREVGDGDNFGKSVRADLTEEMTLEQVLEGGARVMSGGRVFQAGGRVSAKALR